MSEVTSLNKSDIKSGERERGYRSLAICCLDKTMGAWEMGPVWLGGWREKESFVFFGQGLAGPGDGHKQSLVLV